MVVRIALVTIVIAATAATAAAQATVVDDFARLPEVVKKGTIVIVVDNEKGVRTKGKITNLSASTLEIMRDEQRIKFSPAEITHITRLDSRLNGFLIGLAAGAVPGIMLGVGFKTYCSNESASCPGAPAYIGATTGLIGGWIGFAIDGAIDGHTMVFARPRAPGLQFSFKF